MSNEQRDSEGAEPEVQPLETGDVLAWVNVVPPSAFDDRVMQMMRERGAGNDGGSNPQQDDEDSARSRGKPLLSGAHWSKKRKTIVAAMMAALVAVAAVTVIRSSPSARRTGAVIAGDVRQSVTLGGRGVAVTEPGSVLDFAVDQQGGATIRQTQGKVFYRVERGGPFVVHTPAGEVSVTGTCFDVEIQMKKNSQMLVAGIVGAALASAVVVTVYEGGVVVAHGQSKTTVSAGEKMTMPVVPGGSQTAIAVIDDKAGSDGDSVQSESNRNGSAVSTMSKDQLMVHSTVQSDRITMLEAKLSKLETLLAQTASDSDDAKGAHPDQATLARWAKDCKIRFDYPNFDDAQPPEVTVGDRFAAADIKLATAAMKEMHTQWLATVRGAFLEITDDAAAARTLSVEAMEREIADKGGKAEMIEIRTKIANERAGLSAPPAPGTSMSASERYMRARVSLGDDTEAALAKRLGSKRAREIRGQRWDSVSSIGGCADAE